MVLGLESIPSMKLTASGHQPSSDLQKSQKPAAVVSKIGENWDMPARFFRHWRAVDDFSPPRGYSRVSAPSWSWMVQLGQSAIDRGLFFLELWLGLVM